MVEASYGEFIANILRTLERNGFPEKRVSLPLEKMYEVAYEKGLNFNKVLEFLKEKDIDHEKTAERLIFFPKKEPPKDPNPFSAFAAMDPAALGGLDLGEMVEKAAALLKQMPPEQMEQMRRMYDNMTEEEKAALARKAKDMGLMK